MCFWECYFSDWKKYKAKAQKPFSSGSHARAAKEYLYLQLTWDKVAAFEDLCKLLWIFVLCIPDWVSLWVKVFPEMGNGYCQGVLIGVLSLEIVHDKRTDTNKWERLVIFRLFKGKPTPQFSLQHVLCSPTSLNMALWWILRWWNTG